MSERYRAICCSDQTLISVHLCGVNDEIVQEDPQAIEEKKKKVLLSSNRRLFTTRALTKEASHKILGSDQDGPCIAPRLCEAPEGEQRELFRVFNQNMSV